MKKLLLSLFAVAAVFVACDKESIDAQEPLAIEIEEAGIQNSNMDVDFDAAFQFIQNINNSSKVLIESPSSNRGGDYGDNWLQAVFFDRSATNSGDLAYLRSDAQGEVCAGESLVNAQEFFYHLPAPDQLVIEAPSGTNTYTVPSGSYDATFNSDGPDALIVINSDRTAAAAGIAPAVSDYDFTCAPDWAPSASNSDMYVNGDLGSYTIIPAPFPLTGFLARVVTEVNGVTGTLNYAASTRQAVRDAIEADFGN